MLTESELVRVEKLVEKQKTVALTIDELKELRTLEEKQDQPKQNEPKN